MSQASSLPSYQELTEALQKTESNANAAQVHGLICGLICARPEKIDKSWEKQVLGQKRSRHTQQMLRDLFENSYHQLSEFSFEFILLLPDDSIAISLRAEALGLWCQGFITGLEQSEVKVNTDEPSELADALNDIIEIAQVNHDEVSENDEDETAYFELMEYVRLSVLMIFSELNKPSPQNDWDENDIDENDISVH